MSALYESDDYGPVTLENISKMYRTTSRLVDGMTQVCNSLLVDAADDQVGSLQLLLCGLACIEDEAFRIAPGPVGQKAGAA